MSHQSLYRAYRPHTFADVVGQSQVISALTEQIASKKISHAYLFSGSRGLGKTSVARIFAHELSVHGSDLYEIDAASNNSVDDIRSLTENVYTLPFESPYKVYILDEAHMLSKGAWNAFLKTLEEPPAHVIFILATTELAKIPDTVKSRCQVYEFKNASRADITRMVIEVARKEGIALEPSAADLVALLAEGSYRDSLSVLEKILAASQSVSTKTVTRADAERATGAPKHELVYGFVSALAEGNADAALATLARAASESIDTPLYLSLILEELRMVLLVRHAPELRKQLAEELGEGYKEIELLAHASPSKITHTTLKVFLDATERIRFSPIPMLPLELAVFELLGHDR